MYTPFLARSFVFCLLLFSSKIDNLLVVFHNTVNAFLHPSGYQSKSVHKRDSPFQGMLPYPDIV
ncbi:hypothetical protein ACTXT7_011451 [Hymenolepis weldensis]